MKVKIRSVNGVEEILDIVKIKEDSEGIYIAQNSQGQIFTYVDGKPIVFNKIISRTGSGFINGNEYTFEIEGFLNK
ncbi:hypothetical protein [Acinetobacter guillouiae]|uniref:hypothetical protein n=1 Tax=Acinetobacter guillouiae TaxID=106649 RepID=UPI002E227D31